MTFTPKSSRRIVLFSTVALLSFVTHLRATSDSWTGTTSALWSTTTNWSTNPATVPGATDTATFNAASANTTIDVTGVASVNSVVFDTASAAAYTIGTGAAGNQTLVLDNGGSVTMNSTVAANQLFNAKLTLGTSANANTYTITNNSTTNSLTFAGAITGATGNGVKTLNVTGAGATSISGVIANGTTGTVGLQKDGAGTLTLSAQNTYSGGTVVNAGVLQASNTNGRSTGTGAVTINNGGTIRVTAQNAYGNINTFATTINAGGTLTYTGSISNNLNGTVTLAGGTLSGSGSFPTTFGGWNFVNQVNAGGSTTTSVISANGTVLRQAGGTIFNVSSGATNGIDLDVTGTLINATSQTETALVKTGLGVMRLSAVNTTAAGVIVNQGTLVLGIANSLQNSASNVITLGGGTLKSAFSQSLGTVTLSLTAGTSSVLDLDTGCTFVFANSSAATWGAGSTLSIIGTFVDGSSVRFGTDATGLGGTQLSQITINGLAATIDGSGFLVSSVPEPSAYAALCGLLALGLAACRSRRA